MKKAREEDESSTEQTRRGDMHDERSRGEESPTGLYLGADKEKGNEG